MEPKNLKISLKNGILIVKISRPAKLNALNFETMGEIHHIVRKIYSDPEIIGAIFTGEGDKAFVAGADIAEIGKLNEINGRKSAETGQEIYDLIENCPKPIIAAVNGYALGGGCELAMACHMRIASDNARFGQPEINLGIIPGYGGTQRLPQLVGRAKALELLLTGDQIDALEAKEIGLVNHVTKFEDLLPKCEEILNKISKKPPLAVEMIIQCVNSTFNKKEDGYQTEANAFGNCIGTEDFREGTTAFLEKRQPLFHGR